MAEDEITWKMEIYEDGDNGWAQEVMTELMKPVEGQDKSPLEPAEVYSDCPYASYVEFGTTPGMEKPTGPEAERMAKMELWVAKRMGVQDGKRKHKLALWLKRYIETNGIAPSPYMRSSMNVVLDRHCPKGDLNASDYISSGGTLLKLAEEIRDTAMKTMELNGMQVTGALHDSLHAGPIESWTIQGSEVVVTAAEDPSLGDQVWQDPSLGRDGKRPTKHWKPPTPR